MGFEGGFYIPSSCLNERIHPDWADPIKTTPKEVWLRETGFKTVFANDIKRAAKAAWVPYFSRKKKELPVYRTESIIDLVKQFKMQNENPFPSAIDLITGGFPCQDFSVAGNRKGFNSNKCHENLKISNINEATLENRGRLYYWMKEVIEIVQPKVFIAENVKGLISLDGAKDIIEKDFRGIGEEGYVVKARVLKAVEYGVPQTRERVFFMGFLRSALNSKALGELQKDLISEDYDPFPSPTHLGGFSEKLNFGGKEKDLMPLVSVSKVFKDLKEPEFANGDLSHGSYSKAKWMGSHCQGQIEIDLNKPAPTIRSEHHGNIEFRRLSKANGGKYIDELDNGKIERRLTVRECARLQTFPDDFEFVRKGAIGSEFNLSATDGYKVVGNAVPPLLAYHLAQRLKKLWPKLFRREVK